MYKDNKDEQIVSLNRKNKEYEEKLKTLIKENEELKKVETTSD